MKLSSKKRGASGRNHCFNGCSIVRRKISKSSAFATGPKTSSSDVPRRHRFDFRTPAEKAESAGAAMAACPRPRVVFERHHRWRNQKRHLIISREPEEKR